MRVSVLGPSQYLAAKGPGSTHRSGQQIHTNSTSAVVSISVAGESVALLPGDVDGVGLHDLLQHGQDLRAPILVYPHHGALPEAMNPAGFARGLLTAVSPELVVFSIGRGRYATPNPEMVRVLRETQTSARIICTQLSKHCSKELPAGSTSHLSPAFARGRSDGSCCGGTVVVPLDDIAAIHPRPETHASFIGTQVETPLCAPRDGS